MHSVSGAHIMGFGRRITTCSPALVSRFPIYDLMRDYLTLSWARFSKDVQSHTLQISKILSHPAPRPGELIRLDASSAPNHGAGQSETSLEVVARFPGGLDFGRGLVDVNFTMWPLFKCLNIDNVLTICEVCHMSTDALHTLSSSCRLRCPRQVVFCSSRAILPCLVSQS